MDEKIIIGAAGALIGGACTLLAAYLTARYKVRELEFLKHRYLSERKLAAANEKLVEVYIPILSKLELLETSWNSYKKANSTDNLKAFMKSFQGIYETYKAIREKGETVYLVSEFQDEIDHLIRLIKESENTSKTKHVIRTKIEGFGVRSITERVFPSYIAVFIYLFFITMNFFTNIGLFRWWMREITFTNYSLRVYSSPLGSYYFSQEFNLCVSTIKSVSKEIALYKEPKSD
jgi:hypothetical protein